LGTKNVFDFIVLSPSICRIIYQTNPWIPNEQGRFAISVFTCVCLSKKSNSLALRKKPSDDRHFLTYFQKTEMLHKIIRFGLNFIPGNTISRAHAYRFLYILFRIFRKIQHLYVARFAVSYENPGTDFQTRSTIGTITNINRQYFSHISFPKENKGFFLKSKKAKLPNLANPWQSSCQAHDRHPGPCLPVQTVLSRQDQ
jgi:hypothetical protein